MTTAPLYDNNNNKNKNKNFTYNFKFSTFFLLFYHHFICISSLSLSFLSFFLFKKGTEPNQIYKEITRYSKHFPKVAFPKHFPTEGSNILLGLLHPVPDERLGNLNGGSSDVKNHPYFENVDWIKLQQKAVKPDFVPAISDSYDSGNFKERNDDFERTIESDLPNAKHESWAQKF